MEVFAVEKYFRNLLIAGALMAVLVVGMLYVKGGKSAHKARSRSTPVPVPSSLGTPMPATELSDKPSPSPAESPQ